MRESVVIRWGLFLSSRVPFHRRASVELFLWQVVLPNLLCKWAQGYFIRFGPSKPWFEVDCLEKIALYDQASWVYGGECGPQLYISRDLLESREQLLCFMFGSKGQ